MKKYILLYGDKKPEDNICLTNMFKSNKKINLGWTDLDINSINKTVDHLVKDGYEEIIFAGLEIGWDKVINYINDTYPKVLINVICNTQDSLLYYEYERENFFKLLELNKDCIVNKIAFLRKGQYELYKELGYNCCYLAQNFILEDKIKLSKEKREQISLGFYPLNYTWDKNIFNQLCVGKMLNNSVITYNCLDPRMTDFLDTMKIDSKPVKIENINVENIANKIVNNDVVIATSFTEYFYPIFFIAMELGVPCLIGNNSELFTSKDKLSKYIVTSAEDNAIINSQLISNILENKKDIIKLYKEWKEKYNDTAKKSLEKFIG